MALVVVLSKPLTLSFFCLKTSVFVKLSF